MPRPHAGVSGPEISAQRPQGQQGGWREVAAFVKQPLRGGKLFCNVYFLHIGQFCHLRLARPRAPLLERGETACLPTHRDLRNTSAAVEKMERAARPGLSNITITSAGRRVVAKPRAADAGTQQTKCESAECGTFSFRRIFPTPAETFPVLMFLSDFASPRRSSAKPGCGAWLR